MSFFKETKAVKVSMRMTDRVFTNDLTDKTSQAFKDLEAEIIPKVKEGWNQTKN